MKKLFLILLVPLISWAQFQFIPISADYSTFSSTDSTAYVEIYVSIFQGNLSYTLQEDGNYAASFTNNLNLLRNDVSFKEYAHSYQNTTADTSKLMRYNQFVDVFNLEVPYGKYKAKIQMVDNSSQLKGEYVLDLETIKPQPQVYLSDIELCSEIKRDTSKTIFYKNGLRVVPNPRAVFDLSQPMLYYYLEINNLPFSPDENRFYQFQYTVTTAKGDTVRSKSPVKKQILAPTLVEAGGLNVMALPRELYFLNASVKELSSGKVASASRKFYVYKPVKEDTIRSETKIPEIDEIYISFTSKELKEEFRKAKYIATRSEEKVFGKLENDDAMRKFLTQFWLRRDKAINATFGTYRIQYMRRVERANEQFTAMGKKGWRSDQGRILLIYGEPDEYERHPSSMDLLPYVIWHYHNLEGGAQFIFTDQEGFGDYQLIHSTYRKELQNPDWESIISKKTGTNPFETGF